MSVAESDASPTPRYVQKRNAFYESAARMTPFLGTRAGRGVYLVRTEDKHIGKSLFSKEGRGEMHVLARAVTVLEAIFGTDAVEGKTFIDVGANIGTTTIPAVLEHGFARAVAFEPEDDNFVTLRINALLNGLDEAVLAVPLAVSNAVGSSDLVVNRAQGGKHWIATDDEKRSLARPSDEIVTIETTSLDQVAADGDFDPKSTGLLWIDAQAHEGHILEGATRLTALGVPIVLEWDPRALDAIGNRNKIHEIAERDYTHFAGMRADRSGDGPKFSLRPVSELRDYAERFLDPQRTESFTDILIVRLDDDQVPEDLGDAIRQQTQARGAGDEIDLDDLSPEDRARVEQRRSARAKVKLMRAKEERARIKGLRAREKRASDDAEPLED